MKQTFIIFSALLSSVSAMARTETTDSIKTQELDEVVVEERLQRTSATGATYLPTRRQKNAAQTGPELLGHMAIPQLGLVSGNTVTTNTGQKVDLYIDFVPASEQDLSGMKMADVKRSNTMIFHRTRDSREASMSSTSSCRSMSMAAM